MPLTSQRRKTELSRITKRGGTTSLLAFLHRALLDPDLPELERKQYERTLHHLTSRYARVEPEAPAAPETDPFA